MGNDTGKILPRKVRELIFEGEGGASSESKTRATPQRAQHASEADANVADFVPRRVGRYQLVGRIAVGGMGEVFAATLMSSGKVERKVAIKALLPKLLGDPDIASMFINEARIAAQLLHPNVCQVYEMFEENRQFYIVMEYLEGLSLDVLLAKTNASRQLTVRQVCAVVEQTAAGLNMAHELCDDQGRRLDVVHRDVSPANIYLTRSGLVKILDFGVAKARGSDVHTVLGTLKGKYGYMSPEQVLLDQVDRRSDVFALGVVLFEALTRRRLYARRSAYATLKAVMEEPAPSPSTYNPAVNAALDGVVLRALAKDPDNRFPTALDLAEAVSQAVRPSGGPASLSELHSYVNTHFGTMLTATRAERFSSSVHHDGGPLQEQNSSPEEPAAPTTTLSHPTHPTDSAELTEPPSTHGDEADTGRAKLLEPTAEIPLALLESFQSADDATTTIASITDQPSHTLSNTNSTPEDLAAEKGPIPETPENKAKAGSIADSVAIVAMVAMEDANTARDANTAQMGRVDPPPHNPTSATSWKRTALSAICAALVAFGLYWAFSLR